MTLLIPVGTMAQVGEHRSVFSIGAGGGYVMSNVGFTPKVNQKMYGGMMGGLAFRYVCEKYFNTICSVQAEVNYAKIGWKEDILDLNDSPVINPQTGAEGILAHHKLYTNSRVRTSGMGKERRMQFFFQAGPQVGIWLSESTEASYDLSAPNLQDRANRTVAQETMPVENKFDYGIAAGLGMEYSHPKAGHLQLEGRYYYGLGNIYGDSKKRLLRKVELRKHRSEAHLPLRPHEVKQIAVRSRRKTAEAAECCRGGGKAA